MIKRIVESVSEPTMSVGSFFCEKYGIKKKLLRLSNLPYYKEDFVYTNMYRYFCGQECWKIKKRNIVPLLMDCPTEKYNFFHIKTKGQGGGNHDQRQTDVVFLSKEP